MKIKYLILFLFLGIGLQSSVLSQTNEKTSKKIVSNQTQIIKIPAKISAAELDENSADKSSVIIEINKEKKVFLNGKLFNEATKRAILENPELSIANTNSFKPVYVKADVDLKFAEVVKTAEDLVVSLEMIKPSSATFPLVPSPDTHRVIKFIVDKQDAVKDEKSQYVLSLNLPFYTKNPSLDLTVEIVQQDTFKFNNQTTSADVLVKELTTIFQERASKGVFHTGTNKTYKVVRLKTLANAKYDDVIKSINQIYYAGADWVISNAK